MKIIFLLPYILRVLVCGNPSYIKFLFTNLFLRKQFIQEVPEHHEIETSQFLTKAMKKMIEIITLLEYRIPTLKVLIAIYIIL